MKTLSSRWPFSKKESSQASQPSHSNVILSGRNGLADQSVMGSAGGPSSSHFVSIRAGQGPPDPSAHSISKLAATSQILQPPTRPSQDLDDHLAPYSEGVILNGKLDGWSKTNETTRPKWQKPASRTNSAYISVGQLPDLAPINQGHSEGNYTDPPAPSQEPRQHLLAQTTMSRGAVTNPDQHPPSTSSKEIVSESVLAIQPSLITGLPSHQSSLHPTKSPVPSPPKPPLRAIPPSAPKVSGMHSLPQPERPWLQNMSNTVTEMPASNRIIPRPAATARVPSNGLPTYLTSSSSRKHQDDLNMWNTKTVASAQLHSSTTIAGPDPSNVRAVYFLSDTNTEK